MEEATKLARLDEESSRVEDEDGAPNGQHWLVHPDRLSELGSKRVAYAAPDEWADLEEGEDGRFPSIAKLPVTNTLGEDWWHDSVVWVVVGDMQEHDGHDTHPHQPWEHATDEDVAAEEGRGWTVLVEESVERQGAGDGPGAEPRADGVDGEVGSNWHSNTVGEVDSFDNGPVETVGNVESVSSKRGDKRATSFAKDVDNRHDRLGG